MISIIVPVYNTERELQRCIDSILSQTYADFELLLIDDGSTDSSGRLCDSYAVKDKRCKVLHQKNKGLSGARNTGLNECKGDYVMFIDSDDFVHPDLLRVLYQALVSGDYDFSLVLHRPVYDSTPIVHAEQSDYDSYVITRNDYFHSLYNNRVYRNDICTLIDYHVVWAKLYRREVFNRLRFRKVVSEDFEIMNRICMNMNAAILVDAKMYYYLQRENSIIHTNISKQKVHKIRTYLRCFVDIPADNLEYRAVCLQRTYWSIINIRNEIQSDFLQDYKDVTKYILKKTFLELLFNKKVLIKTRLLLLFLTGKILVT